MVLPDVAEPPYHIRLYFRFIGEEWRVDNLNPSGFEVPPYDSPFFDLGHWENKVIPFVLKGLLVGILITIARFLFEKFISMPLGHNVVKDRKDVPKFVESVTKMSYYLCAWLAAFYVLIHQPYWTDGYHQVLSVYRVYHLGEIPEDIEWVYLMSLGWYLHNMYSFFFVDSKKKDDAIMLAHHVVTVTLITLSYAVGYFDFGLQVLFSMDICDVFLELMRALRLCLLLNPFFEFLCFLPIPISWLLFRIAYYYKAVMEPSLFFVTVLNIGWQNSNFYFVFNLLLFSLLAMNVYWFIMILRVALLTVSGKRLHDTREADAPSHTKKHR
eukprot:CAMPEP_0119126674 /NCGR_PEP_ID=MMETSP1310-20130426/5506_1 /TAXON_ID=464262 /ORGANISM="Genus nov. species nov., Strain RCC2339" /LENGTH=325 /DNA_ID=CAMNT_0007116845 /DNA_START=186 /DNA_END=1163 /DNA_ORIENTATION=-